MGGKWKNSNFPQMRCVFIISSSSRLKCCKRPNSSMICKYGRLSHFAHNLDADAKELEKLFGLAGDRFFGVDRCIGLQTALMRKEKSIRFSSPKGPNEAYKTQLMDDESKFFKHFKCSPFLIILLYSNGMELGNTNVWGNTGSQEWQGTRLYWWSSGTMWSAYWKAILSLLIINICAKSSVNHNVNKWWNNKSKYKYISTLHLAP